VASTDDGTGSGTDGTPIAYGALATGTPVNTRDGHRIGSVEHVLEIPEEDLFDGIVVATADGLRFVDRDQVLTITDRAVTCDLDEAAAATLPAPEGSEVYHVDALQDAGSSLHDRFGRMFRRGKWTLDQNPDQD
jgi:hypothetical protein